MENTIAVIGQRIPGKVRPCGSATNKIKRNDDRTALPLRLAREGDRVRIVSLSGGRGFHDRLAGLGLRIGERVEVIQNRIEGKEIARL